MFQLKVKNLKVKMRIAVIAADGRLGRQFVDVALRNGHSVRAGVRGGNTLPPHPQLEVVSCDATDVTELRVLLQNQEVVVSALGHVKGSAVDVQTVATKTVLIAMAEQKIRRYVDVTGTGVRFPGDVIPFIDRILNTAVATIDSNRVKDGHDHQEILKKSTVDWTTIRVLKLQNVAPKPFTLKLHGPTKLYVGREEVAMAMLEVIDQHSFIKQAPIVSKA